MSEPPDTLSLAEVLDLAPRRLQTGTRCAVAALYEWAEGQGLRERTMHLINDRNIQGQYVRSAVDVATKISRTDFKISDQSITRHRRGYCLCSKASES